MLFHEIYGSYFETVAAILTEAVSGGLTARRMTALVQERAFAESTLTIPSALTGERWPLLTPDLRTPLAHAPSMPLTTLEKRWLKALLLDPRIALFAPSAEGLEEVEPLYPPEALVYYDRYTDGNPYTDPAYIANFRTVLAALREHRRLRIRYKGHTGLRHTLECVPLRLEYSAKDDKFRLITCKREKHIVNLARMADCELLEPFDPDRIREPTAHKEEIVFLLHNERNALERVLLHFSHLEKETVRLGYAQYRVTLRYDREDETELLIRLLSFGPVIEVESPQYLIDQMRARIQKQLQMPR